MVNRLASLPKWALIAIVFGVILNLGISGVLILQTRTLNRNTEAAHCWDKTLDNAIRSSSHPSAARTATLKVEADRCVKLIP